jgi:tetratricopeptide (TPR) repeat protein
MATDTAAAPPARPAPDPARHYWQVPTFLLGVAVFAAAWQGWLPLGTPDPAGAFARDLAALRAAYEKVTPDRDELKALLAKVAAGVEDFPEQGPAARFALGSGYARLAELTTAPDEARAHWSLARQHFERVRPEDLKDPADAPRLAFRAAKARAGAGLPAGTPQADLKLHITLLGNVPLGEEPGEAGRLQADLAMRLTPPDLQAAKEGLTRYLTTTGIATPAAALARAKLHLGDVHFRRRENESARKWLEQIGTDAPPDVVAPARAALARVRMAEEDWLGAARDWEVVRGLPGVPAALRMSAAYQLGVCKVNAKDAGGAAGLFDEAAKGDGPEAVAAAVRLADLYARGEDKARRALAPDLLARAVRGVSAPGEYRNGYIKLPDLQNTFDLVISTLIADGAFEPAVKAAEAYAAVASPGRDREKRAEALAAWAAALDKAQSPDAKEKAAAAAKEYAGLVEVRAGDPAKADALRRAAGMHKLAGDPAAALDTLRQAVRLNLGSDDAAAAVWVDLAEGLVAAGDPDAWKAFNQAMAAAGPVSTATRYRLARHFTDTRHPGLGQLGRGLFEQIAQQETVTAAEQGVHELAMRELAHEFIRAGNYPEAEVWLRKQLGLYPNGPEGLFGRLLLGVCLLQKAGTPSAAAPDKPEAPPLREEAVRLFQEVVAAADARQKKDGKLSERDAWLRLQAGLRVLQALQHMQRPNDLLSEAAVLLDRHRGTVEELIVLSLVYHAYKQKGEPGKALQTRDQMKELFDKLPPAAFPQATGEYSRAYWEKVWFAEK